MIWPQDKLPQAATPCTSCRAWRETGRRQNAIRSDLLRRAQARRVRVITLNDDDALINYAKPIVAELRANMVRVDSDCSATPFKAKISNAEQLRVHTMLVIGGRDMDAGAVSVRLHGKGHVGAKPKAEAVAEILASIKERRA